MTNDPFDDDPEVKRELRRIDGVLPKNIDRRSFFKKTMASVMGLGALAGCTGDGDDDGGSTPTTSGTTATGTSEQRERVNPGEISFRNFWRPKQGYAFEYMTAVGAEGKPSFMDEQMNASPPEMSAGTNDASQYTGTGEAELGLSSWSITINGTENDWDSVTFGMSNPKAFVGLIYDESVIEDEYHSRYTPFGPEDAPMSPSLTDFISLTGGAEVVEFTVSEGAGVAGLSIKQAVADGLLTDEMLVVGIERDGDMLTPKGETVVQTGDVVSVLSKENLNTDALAVFAGQ